MPAPVRIDDHAIENLRYIRETMERASSFTAVPGRGGAAMGVIGLFAAVLAWRASSTEAWLFVWLAASAAAVFVGATAMMAKAQATGAALSSAPARKFALSFAPPLA